jgi:hypothetical protein
MDLNRKTRIAALIAALAFGTAGIAAIEQSQSNEVVEAAEQAPGESAQTTAVEQAPAETAAAPDPAAAVEPAPAKDAGAPATAPAPAVVAQPRSWFSRLLAAIRSGKPVDLFQAQAETEWPLLPSQMAYFERLEQSRKHLVATGDSFPMPSGDNGLLPSQIAYFERLEQQRLARVQPQAEPRIEVEARASVEAPQAAGTATTIAQGTGSETVVQ